LIHRAAPLPGEPRLDTSRRAATRRAAPLRQWPTLSPLPFLQPSLPLPQHPGTPPRPPRPKGEEPPRAVPQRTYPEHAKNPLRRVEALPPYPPARQPLRRACPPAGTALRLSLASTRGAWPTATACPARGGASRGRCLPGEEANPLVARREGGWARSTGVGLLPTCPARPHNPLSYTHRPRFRPISTCKFSRAGKHFSKKCSCNSARSWPRVVERRLASNPGQLSAIQRRPRDR